MKLFAATLALFLLVASARVAGAEDLGLKLAWKDNYLTISGDKLPGREMKVLYMEAYCRPGSTARKWEQTTIGHKTRLVSGDPDGKRLVLECELKDGVKVRHEILARADEVEFRITANNSTDRASDAHWAQPCIRVDAFSGRDKNTYLDKCFLFVGGQMRRMPTPHWATQAVYTPGQVWCPKHVDRDDVNPRPLSPDVPDNGLVGCYSADEKMVFAVAFEPYQELFQGIAACLHSDFRFGGLKAGETKNVRGKIYFVPADVEELLKRYRSDFPEHFASAGAAPIAAARAASSPGSQTKLKALIIDGQNNHNWRATTPVLKAALEDSGRFTVDVATSPQDKDWSKFRPTFSNYDVVVSNYNGDPWPEEVTKVFEDYVRGGGGFVAVHAADNSFPQWLEYNKMIGVGGWGDRNEKHGPMLRWRDGKVVRDNPPGAGGTHGAYHEFPVQTRDPQHPIMKGLPEKWMHTGDELYATLRGPAENITVLATANSDVTHQDEPMLMAISYGKGRVFHTTLGHDERSMKCWGFVTTLRRGAEWAATGDVTLPKPEQFPGPDKVSKWAPGAEQK